MSVISSNGLLTERMRQLAPRLSQMGSSVAVRISIDGIGEVHNRIRGIPHGFTKALLERFWSLRHVHNLLKGKLAATVLTGLQPDVLDRVNLSLATELKDYENMDLIGQLTIQGNLPCLTCGQGDVCQMSGLKVLYGPDARTSDFGYKRVEDQQKVFNEAQRIGILIGERLQSSDDA